MRSDPLGGDLTPLILDFLEWISAEPRPYREVMDAWRTSCPRLTVWEDSVDAGLVARRQRVGAGFLVECTPKGLSFLARAGRTRFATTCQTSLEAAGLEAAGK